jgi:riboflavin biosynthesis pyrimidine reductase
MAASGSQPLAQCLSAGIPVREVAADDEGLPDPAESLRVLYAEGIGSVLVEGGSRLLTRLLAEGLWDALTVFTAPLILGQGIEAVGDLGILTPGDGIRLQGPRLQAFEGFTRLDARNPATSVDVPTPVKEGACLQD